MTDLLLSLVKEGYSISFTPYFMNDIPEIDVVNVLMSKDGYRINHPISFDDIQHTKLSPDDSMKCLLEILKGDIEQHEMIRIANEKRKGKSWQD